MKFLQMISFYNVVLSVSMREDPSLRLLNNHAPIESTFHSQKRNFMPSPIYLVSKLPWLDMSKLIDELLVYD